MYKTTELSAHLRALAGEIGLEPINAAVKVLCLHHLTTPQYNKTDKKSTFIIPNIIV